MHRELQHGRKWGQTYRSDAEAAEAIGNILADFKRFSITKNPLCLQCYRQAECINAPEFQRGGGEGGEGYRKTKFVQQTSKIKLIMQSAELMKVHP